MLLQNLCKQTQRIKTQNPKTIKSKLTLGSKTKSHHNQSFLSKQSRVKPITEHSSFDQKQQQKAWKKQDLAFSSKLFISSTLCNQAIFIHKTNRNTERDLAFSFQKQQQNQRDRTKLVKKIIHRFIGEWCCAMRESERVQIGGNERGFGTVGFDFCNKEMAMSMTLLLPVWVEGFWFRFLLYRVSFFYFFLKPSFLFLLMEMFRILGLIDSVL